MDPDAFDALLECVGGGAFDKCETVPAGDDYGFLVQPIGGIAVESTGPARCGDYLAVMFTTVRIYCRKGDDRCVLKG